MVRGKEGCSSWALRVGVGRGLSRWVSSALLLFPPLPLLSALLLGCGEGEGTGWSVTCSLAVGGAADGGEEEEEEEERAVVAELEAGTETARGTRSSMPPTSRT